VAAKTTRRVKLAFYLMERHKITPVRHHPIRPISVLYRRLHLNLIGVSIGTERSLVAGGTKAIIPGRIETVIRYERRRMIKSRKGLHRPPLLIGMAFRTTHPAGFQGLRMPIRKVREGLHLGAGH